MSAENAGTHEQDVVNKQARRSSVRAAAAVMALYALIFSSPATAGPIGDLELSNSWGVQTIGADLVHSLGNRGSGVKIGIIDSGIDYGHPEFSGNYAGGWDFVNNDNDPFDDYGHGTEVAGLIGAASNGSGMVGVAPEASLYAYKVFNSSGAGSYTSVIAALDRAIIDGIDVVNLSFGSPGDPGQSLLDACNRAAMAGIVVVASAGNYGGFGTADTIIFPGRYPSVIAVGATTMADERASFSGMGPTLDLVAPGVDLYTTARFGGYTTVSGTSFSTPYVTGAAALLIHDGFSDIQAWLTATAYDLGPFGFDTMYGYGRLDLHPMVVPVPSAIALALMGLPLATCVKRRSRRPAL